MVWSCRESGHWREELWVGSSSIGLCGPRPVPAGARLPGGSVRGEAGGWGWDQAERDGEVSGLWTGCDGPDSVTECFSGGGGMTRATWSAERPWPGDHAGRRMKQRAGRTRGQGSRPCSSGAAEITGVQSRAFPTMTTDHFCNNKESRAQASPSPFLVSVSLKPRCGEISGSSSSSAAAV